MKKFLLLAALTPSLALAGPYAAHGVTTGDTTFTGWATGVSDLRRGLQNIANPGGPLASFGTGANALGTQDGTLVSLGDGGSITLAFASGIANGAGADFAVFENGFASGGGVYAELAFVDVSSNGRDFFRMPSVSLTPTATGIGGFGTLDPTDVHNLAGQYGDGEGTPFDLADLAGISSLLDVNAVRFVRLTDVVGSIDPAYGSRDSLGNLINDPYSTPFASGGFDLDAVGVIHAAPVPEPGTFAILGLAALILRRRRR